MVSRIARNTHNAESIGEDSGPIPLERIQKRCKSIEVRAEAQINGLRQDFRAARYLRIPFLVALLLVVGGLVVWVPGCGDDDPVSPAIVDLLPNLATADSAAVTLHILGAVQYRDATHRRR